MGNDGSDEVTRLLLEWSRGDEAALKALMPLVHSELRRLARGLMRRERSDHTLETTALVNEAYLRLVDQRRVSWQGRAHFFGVAAGIMRRILVDHARKHRAVKRGRGIAAVTLPEAIARPRAEREIVALDDALKALEQLDPRQGRIVEMKYFVGMSGEEIAAVLGISPATVKREWRIARMWLRRELAR